MKLHFKQFNDSVDFYLFSWLFNLFRGRNKKNCIYSSSYDIEATGFTEYLTEIGRKESLIEILKSKRLGIKSMSTEEAIVRTAVLLYGQSIIFVIHNWDNSQLGRIKDRLPGIDADHFYEDIIFIPLASRAAANKLKALLPSDMAYTMIIDAGICVDGN